MRHLLAAACLLVGSGVTYAAADDSVGAVQLDLRKLSQKANTEKRALTEDELMVLVDRCWKLYDQFAGEEEELLALQQIVQLSPYATGPKVDEAWLEAMKHLTKDFVDDPRLADLVIRCPASKKMQPDRDRLFGEVETKTTSADVKAAFAYKKLQPLIQQSDDGQLDENATKAFVEKLEALAKAHGPAMVPFEGVTYADWVATKLYAMEHLKVGAVSPDIVGKDLDAVDFKLSDYRGKVVLLDFWGYW